MSKAITAMKLRIAATDPNPKELTPQQRQEWNAYVDWLDKKGMKGSTELDKGDTGLQYFNQFLKENPSISLRPEHIKAVQQEIEGIAQKSRDLLQRQGNPNAQNVMRGTSKFDNIPGSKTTSFKFPEMNLQAYHNNAMVANRNLGLVNSQLQPQVGIFGSRQAQIPKGTKLEQFYDSMGKPSGTGYTDKNGDVVIVTPPTNK